MSLSKVGYLQRRIYEELLQDSILAKKVSGIFLFPPRDSLFPFLLINVLKLTDFSKYERYNYDIDFEICIFEKDNNLQRILKLAERIIYLIRPEISSSADFSIISLKFVEAIWSRGVGNNSTKISLNFKVLIAGVYE